MDLIKVRDKYRQKIKFFESKDILNFNHIKVFVKGLTGMKTFIIDNNDMFEPIAIEWLDCYYECRNKFDEELFYTSVFYTSPTIIKILLMKHTSTSFINDFAYRYFEILYHVPEHILARIFIYQLSVFKMLAITIFDCDVYSNQVTLLEILFRFVNEYRNYQFEEEQQNTPDLISTGLFPDINNKDELIKIFLNMKKASFDFDSRLFLNKLNRYVKNCIIFSIVADSIKFNDTKLTPPILSNQSYQFWIDFNIRVLQISFPCKGVENENDWVANLIIKEDLERIIFGKNDTHLIISIYLKRNSNLNSLIPIFDSNLYKIDFKFILNHNTSYLEKNVLPCYQSYINSNNTNIIGLSSIIQQNKKHKRCQKILTTETIERINKYGTIVEERDAEGQQLHAKIIEYANNTISSFTFDQSFSKSSNSFNINIFKDSALKAVFQKQTSQVVPAVTVIKPPALSDLTNKVANKTTTKIVKGNKRKRNTVANVVKDIKQAPNKLAKTENSDFDQLKSNGKSIKNTKRTLYTKQVIEEGVKGSESSKENIKQRKRAKPRKNKLINRVVPLQTDIAKKKNNVRNSDYSISEILKIKANVEIINSGIENNNEIIESENVEPNLSFDRNIQTIEKNSPSVYDIRNIQRVETRDEEFVSNIITQVRSQKEPSQNLQRKQNIASTINCELISAQTSTPLANINNMIDNKNVSNSYRRFAKSKDITKLGYNTNIDLIEPYIESSLNKYLERPLRVQGFRQSKAKIKNLCEISSSMNEDEDDENCQTIGLVVSAEVHLPNHSEKLFIASLSGLSNNVLDKPPINTFIGINKTPNISIPKQTEKESDELEQIAISMPMGMKTIMTENEISNIPIIKQNVKQAEKRSGKLEQEISISPPIGQNTITSVNEVYNIPIIKQITKPYPTISIPMPMIIDEIKTEYIISVDDESDCENIDRNPVLTTQVSLEETNVYSSISKRKRLETEDEAKSSSDMDESSNQMLLTKRTPLLDEFKQIKNNTVSSIKNAIMGTSSRKLDGNRSLSPHRELIKYRYPSIWGQRSKHKRHTFSVDSNIAQNYGIQQQLQMLIDMFNHTLKNETDLNEIQTELLNIKKVRLEKVNSLNLVVEAKNLNLDDKKAQIIGLLETIKEQEAELKVSYKNLSKKIEKLTKCINTIHAEIWQGENEINQIRQTESNLSKQLIKTISEHGENIKDEIWKQYVLDLGNNIQQHFMNRYL